jgi:serine/threonine protein kinase
MNLTTGEILAVKQVGSTSVVEALRAEGDILRDLDHPNIVQYLGLEQTPDALSM